MSSSDQPPAGEPDVGRFEGKDQHGWSPDVDEAIGDGPKTAGEGGRKAFDASNAPEPGPRTPISKEEREGVSPTDMTAASPLGVGVSTGTRGEDIAKTESQPGHHDTGPRGPSQRPSGTSSAERSHSIDPQEPIDPDSPNLTPS